MGRIAGPPRRVARAARPRGKGAGRLLGARPRGDGAEIVPVGADRAVARSAAGRVALS